MASVKRAYPPTAEDMAYVSTTGGLVPVVASLTDAGVVPTPGAFASRIGKIAAPAADTQLVPATANREWGFLTYDGTGEMRITFDGRAATLTDYDLSVLKGDVVMLTGRTLAIHGIDVTPNGFVRTYEELAS